MKPSKHDTVNEELTIEPVNSRQDMKDFIELTWQIYADDPMWVPPLRLERRLHLSGFNPYFKNARWRGWVARYGSRPVGRISAQVDEISRSYHGSDTGHFGFLEGINDTKVFAALFDASEAWLRDQEAKIISGPFNFSINQECGVLVDGFDTPPVILMPHSRQWYAGMLEEHGYLPEMDLLAYWVNSDFKPSRVLSTILKRYSGQISVRKLRRNRFSEELELLREIFNDAWSNNWGFIPFSKEEFAELGNTLKVFIPDEYIQIAEVKGVPAAFIVLLPNLNDVLKELNGSLFPFGWAKIVSAIKKKTSRTGRVPLMGVRKQFQNSPLGMALAFLVCSTARDYALKQGMEGAEMSWILENNKGMRSMLDNVEGKEYKRYRIYRKEL